MVLTNTQVGFYVDSTRYKNNDFKSIKKMEVLPNEQVWFSKKKYTEIADHNLAKSSNSARRDI